MEKGGRGRRLEFLFQSKKYVRTCKNYLERISEKYVKHICKKDVTRCNKHVPFDHDISNCFNTFMNPGSGASETGTGEVQGEVEMFRIINFKMKKGFTNSTSVRITKTKFHFTSSHFLESASHLLFVFLIFSTLQVPHHLPIKSALVVKVKVWRPPVGRPLRVVCLHGTCSNGHITKASENDDQT